MWMTLLSQPSEYQPGEFLSVNAGQEGGEGEFFIPKRIVESHWIESVSPPALGPFCDRETGLSPAALRRAVLRITEQMGEFSPERNNYPQFCRSYPQILLAFPPIQPAPAGCITP